MSLRQKRAGERTARVLTWMAANCHRPGVRSAEIASVAGVSERRLQAVFSRDFGCGPVRLMAAMRLHRAHLALAGQAAVPAVSAAEAAAIAGYRRLDRFRAAYRARYGRNPVPLPPQGRAADRGSPGGTGRLRGRDGSGQRPHRGSIFSLFYLAFPGRTVTTGNARQLR